MTQEEKDFQKILQEEDRIRFGKFLKKLREEKGLSIRKCSTLCDLSASYWSYLERGKFGPPSIRKTKQIAKALDVNSDVLMAEAGHFPREMAELIRSNPDEVFTAVNNIDSSDLSTQLPLIRLGIYNPILHSLGLEKILHEKKSEELFSFVKAIIESNDMSKDRENEYFQKLSEVMDIWKIDLESR